MSINLKIFLKNTRFKQRYFCCRIVSITYKQKPDVEYFLMKQKITKNRMTLTCPQLMPCSNKLRNRPKVNRYCANQYVLYGRNLPLIVILTRSPLGSASRVRSMLKSMALMMPSPNSSWISDLKVVP